jgi:transposase
MREEREQTDQKCGNLVQYVDRLLGSGLFLCSLG